MGFLDKKDRILDVVLTEEGKRLYAKGELNFAYFSVFDDEIDYDPWSSGSLTDAQRSELIESSPIMEAMVIPNKNNFGLSGAPRSNVFSAPAGYSVVPSILIETTASTIAVKQSVNPQTSVQRYNRFDSSKSVFKLSHSADIDPTANGFFVEVFEELVTGSFEKIDAKIDNSGQISFGPFIIATKDSTEK